MNDEIIAEQKEICKRYGVDFIPSPRGWKLGISKNINEGTMPINGLRHQPENGTIGWYIWAGDYSDKNEFFETIHTEHLEELCPPVLKYLGLPPGWRFQIDNQGHEDAWEDHNLLNT